MDHYNEQLLRKATEGKDTAVRVLIIVGALAVAGLSIFASFVFAQYLGFFPLIIGMGAVYLGYWLLMNTIVEYEYIVTNHDFDVDKILGKRKRKRLVNLGKTQSWGEYTGNESFNVNATVMASDATGTGMWYLVADHDKIGKVLVLFSPNSETISNINHGVPYNLRKRLPEAEEEAAEAE